MRVNLTFSLAHPTCKPQILRELAPTLQRIAARIVLPHLQTWWGAGDGKLQPPLRR